MKRSFIAAALFLLFTGLAYSQEFDPAFGINGLTTTSAADADSNHTPQAVSGGVFPSFGADVLFLKFHRLQAGVISNVAWRGGQGNYLQDLYGNNIPYRPIFYTFNGLVAAKVNKRITVEGYGGLGGESVRFYQGSFTCSFTGCTNYTSSNHFLGDIGGGVRLYVWNRLFVRPEAQVYFVRNNVEFSSAVATRAGVSIGYTFGNR